MTTIVCIDENVEIFSSIHPFIDFINFCKGERVHHFKSAEKTKVLALPEYLNGCDRIVVCNFDESVIFFYKMASSVRAFSE